MASKTPSFTLDQFTESNPQLLVSEASDLGFPVGEWPERVLVGGEAKSVFLKVGPVFAVGTSDLQYVAYKQLGGRLLIRIYND